MENLFNVNQTIGELANQVSYAITSSAWTGTSIILKYIRESHQNDPYRTFLELLLVVVMIWVALSKKHKPGATDVKLTEKEVEELCQQWEPEPLVPDLTPFQEAELKKLPITQGQAGCKVKLQDGRERLNLAHLSFLGLMNRESIKEKAIAALRKYGVGSCGPPGFYGTIDVHVELESQLATFCGHEAAIIYSQGFSTVASAIPAFAKRGDTIVADEAIAFHVQKGVSISRSNVVYFKHNDMDDLERVLEDLKKADAKKRTPLTRKFIVVEGLYGNTGSIAPLPQLIELKKRFKYRLIVEESLSFGVLGERGAGLADHFRVPPSDVDIMVGSMANTLGSSGGFVCGSKEICEHQRLSGLAYTFSASLPAMLAVSAIEALKIMEAEPELVQKLKENATLFFNTVTKNVSQVQFHGGISKDGSVSPLILVTLNSADATKEEQERMLQDIVDLALKEGVLITRAKYCSSQERIPPVPSLRILVNAGLSRKEVEKAACVVKDCIRKVVKK